MLQVSCRVATSLLEPCLTHPPAELLTPSEMAQADRQAVALGRPVAWLMHNAGRAVARAMRARMPPCRVLALCGPGNNGGDGYVAARLLAESGWPVAVAALAPPTGEAAHAAARWHGPVQPFTAHSAARADVAIDAVFGAGLTRDLDAAVSNVLRAARRIVAVDVPSGLDGATGQARGAVAAAELTVSFFRRKPGHLLLPGRTLCGEFLLADIGLPDAALAGVTVNTFHNGPKLWSIPVPQTGGHKYGRGHVTVLGGALMTGAARLAAHAARRGGAGMVTIAAGDAAALYRGGEAGNIVSDRPLDALAQDAKRVFVCGPGLGAEQARAALPMLLAAGRAVVADADSFSAFAGEPDAFRGATVLTPHAGEFARVFGDPGPDRLAAARAAAARTGAVVLLKGADTIVAAPDGRAAINDSAPPWLATAGSGDTLAGLIAALLAQGMPPWDAACAGAWLHGRAGAHAGPHLIAEDLADALRPAFAEVT
jgi:ADP-dependent NAD(P)H-hydrate dehydratase / NAD(P)H-hydrate epimerase